MLITPSKKSLKEIMKSDVSLGNLKELMTLDLSHAFTSEEERLKESSMQFQNLVEQLEVQGRQTGDLLIEKGLITQEQWESLLTEMAETQTPLSTLLIKHRIAEPNTIGELAEELRTDMENSQTGGASLKEILIKENLIDEEGIERALEEAKKSNIRFSQAVVSLGLVPFQKMAEIYKTQYGIETVEGLRDMQIEFQVVNLVPDNLMKTNELLPFRRKGKKLSLAMSDPRNRAAIKKIEMMTTLEVIPYLADRRELLKRLDEFVVAPDLPPDRAKGLAPDEESFRALLQSDSAVKMVNRIIEGALNTRGTDIHVEPQEKGLRIRYRIDGMLYDIMTIPREMGIPTVSRLKVLAGMDVTERRRPQDGHISYDMEGKRYNLRAATLPTHLGEKVVLRVHDDTMVLKGLNHLGMDETSLSRLKELIHLPYGMILVTGPIGSGKTTTLYTSLSEINHQSRNIVTLEDPVEYQLPGINQVQVDRKIDLGFASGLRSILRQDANILMVGEIRDPETAATAVRAANTGHLLFSTMHTNHAVTAITALQHLGVPPFQIATALEGVIAQRLVRVLDPETKIETKPSNLAKEFLGLSDSDTVFKADPKAVAMGTGYSGRVGVFEVLRITDRIKEAIVSGASEQAIERIAEEDGFITLAEGGKRKILEGATDFDEVARVIALQKENNGA
jgi:type IV pilus assembly protein PilB